MMGVMTRSMMNLLATRLSANSLCIPLFSRNESPSPVYAPSPRSPARRPVSKTPSLIRNVRRKLTCGGSKTPCSSIHVTIVLWSLIVVANIV